MHNKKLLLIMSLIMLATVCIGVVSAVDDTLELDGVKFHIPSGYDEITSYATDDEVEEYSSFDVTSSHRTYMNGNDYLGITVSEYSDHPNLESLKLDDDVSKEIGGVEGLYAFDQLHFFTYADGDKIIQIAVDDMSIIEDVMDTENIAK